MKIDTITFCNTTNVGAALQEYALQKYLQLKGHEVKVVNYIPDIMTRRNSVWSVVLDSKSVHQFMKGLILLPVNVYRKAKYVIFSKRYINLTTICRETDDIKKMEQPDLFIVGSDQVWNDELTDWRGGYFLQFNTTARKAAYAASVGKDEISSDFMHQLRIKIQDFCGISVREKNLQEAFTAIEMPYVEQVLDPVFLLPKEHYESILKKPKIVHYVLLYEAEINENCILAARNIAAHYDLKIVQLNRINNRYKVDQLYPCVSPTEFLGLVKYADYIVTNSFHAVAISLIMEKQFWVIKLKKLFSRLESILKIADIENRVITDHKMDFADTINYAAVNNNLIKWKRQSMEFLDSLTGEEL
jgi:hypothetical protein